VVHRPLLSFADAWTATSVNERNADKNEAAGAADAARTRPRAFLG